MLSANPAIVIRPAQLEDIPALEALIARSVMTLQAEDYTLEQRQGALGTVFGVDRQLLRDGTYYIAEVGAQIAGCGGWSRRQTLFGSDTIPGKDDTLLHPATDAARIRAFFVDPRYARRGIGAQILQHCEAAAQSYGFHRFELGATLTGVPLYSRYGYTPIEQVAVALKNGHSLPIVRMAKNVDEKFSNIPV